MYKHGLLTMILTCLFSLSPAMANHHEAGHEGAKHPAHEMGDAALSDSEKTEQLSDEYRKNLEAAKDTKNAPHPSHKMGAENTHIGHKHPAHEMGEAENDADEQKEALSESYKDNLKAAEDASNAPHPAHEMGDQ
jgi:hypothetical protein